jgi:hypothetical protein
MFCAACGSSLKPGNRFCSKCGASTTRPTAPDAFQDAQRVVEDDAASPRQTFPLARILGIYFFLMFAVGGAGALAWQLSAAPDGSLQNEQAAATDGTTPSSPDSNAKREMIERSLSGIWRETPYKIISISYDDEVSFHDERAETIDKTGTSFKAKVTLELEFPEGWHADCLLPGASYFCQSFDANLMQVKIVPVGGRRTYVGTLEASRLRHGDRAWDSGVAWTQNFVEASASG